MEEGLPWASEAGAARRRADESRADVQEDSRAAKRDRISQAPAGNLKKSHEHTGGGTVKRYAMIEELAVQFRVRECCVALRVSRIGYYRWTRAAQSLRAEANAELLKQIRESTMSTKDATAARGLPSSFGRR